MNVDKVLSLDQNAVTLHDNARQNNCVEIKLKLKQPQHERGMGGWVLRIHSSSQMVCMQDSKHAFLLLLKQERFSQVEAIGHMTAELIRHWVNGDEADV